MADEKSPVDEDVTKDTADASEQEDDPSSDEDITTDDAPNDDDSVEPGEEDDEDSAVEKTCVFFVGIVVFFSMRAVITPPIVSMPRDNGVTSRSRTSFTSPAKTAPWIDAPIATASSGFTSRRGSLLKNAVTFS